MMRTAPGRAAAPATRPAAGLCALRPAGAVTPRHARVPYRVVAVAGATIPALSAIRTAMFSFLKKKTPAEPPKPASGKATPPATGGGFSPEDLTRAFTAHQEEKAARAEAERQRTRERMQETVGGSSLARSFGALFASKPKLDEDLLDEIETVLLTADVGVKATTQLIEDLRRRMKAGDFRDAADLVSVLRSELRVLLVPVAKPLVIDPEARPFVILTVGVNGVGKTTTIGKLAKRFQDEGHSLMLAAGDTFRAAAVEQLKVWGERNNVPVIAQGQNADAASVAFDALQSAKSRGTQVLIADTAGRLHTQSGLMDELGKIRRVLGKLDPKAPHEVLMVIDGTTGQNALNQLRQFHAAAGVTGLVVTKLDGTAKGGVLFALAREFQLPIRFVGLGEKLEDLRVFDPDGFVDALLPESIGG
ncbi:signal recognition particle-docking protein FtsY [Alkalisalibacterium limincola]|uniref:Signal recognition particle receptor FtsY n=2 Tax=Alkalisalibacterium limincola TaxID=2699169 RepID=A0A5C8KKH2_9GAMM|nr:signal recognition particle-docking protein FtsY [Alkalisalibacterium limincola]